MINRHSRKPFGVSSLVLLAVLMLCVNLSAQVGVSVIPSEGTTAAPAANSDFLVQNKDYQSAPKDDTLDLNGMIVTGELYLWNRFKDIFDILRVGVGAGFGIGAEVAVTDYCALGFDARNTAHGADFPHFIPPLWLINYYEKVPVFNIHHTDEPYFTAVAGPWRYENIDTTMRTNFLYPRHKWDVRVQADLAVLSAYVAVPLDEVLDLVGGFVGFDPMNDDDVADQNVTRLPADQFGRSICNIAFGVIEVPSNILRVTEQEGDLAGISKGVGLGIWRFLVREVVGVVELITFPFGWSPIIEPEYIFQKKRGHVWQVNRPAFQKNYRSF